MRRLLMPLASSLKPLLSCLVFCVACGSENRDRDKVLAGIDRLQSAPAQDYEARKTLARELLAIQVTSEPAVRARDACANAYLRLAESNELSEALQKELQDTSKKSDPADLVKRLDTSEKLLAEAEPLLETCKQARGDLVAPVSR